MSVTLRPPPNAQHACRSGDSWPPCDVFSTVMRYQCAFSLLCRREWPCLCGVRCLGALCFQVTRCIPGKLHRVCIDRTPDALDGLFLRSCHFVGAAGCDAARLAGPRQPFAVLAALLTAALNFEFRLRAALAFHAGVWPGVASGRRFVRQGLGAPHPAQYPAGVDMPPGVGAMSAWRFAKTRVLTN